MWNLKALVATIVTAVVLAIPLYYYWEYLTRGMRPPSAMQKLDQLEKSGVPDFELPDLQGNPVRLYDYKGRMVLVNIWATWCAPCVKEFPSLRRLVEVKKGQVVVLAISHDKNMDDIMSFLRVMGELPKDFVVIWDKEKKAKEIFGTEALPETYILDKDLKLIRKVAGDTVWDDEMALEFFRNLLEKQGAGAAGEGPKSQPAHDSSADQKPKTEKIPTH